MNSKKLKLAIIDSGIDKTKMDEVLKIYNYTNETDFDLNGHGTNTYNYILNLCTDIEVIIFKILDKNGKSNGKMFMDVLKHIIDIDINVICMPFSFKLCENLKNVKKIKELFCKLENRGTIMICSYMNGYNDSFPANDDKVIGVIGGFLQNNLEYWYNKETMVTSIYPECIRSINNKRVFFSGNSKACALATSIVISKFKQIDIKQCKHKIIEKLLRDAYYNKWDCTMINRNINSILKERDTDINNKIFISHENAKIKQKILDILTKYTNSNYIYKKNAEFDAQSYQLINNMDLFLNEICCEFSIEIDDNDIYPYDFVNPIYLLVAVRRWIKSYEKN